MAPSSSSTTAKMRLPSPPSSDSSLSSLSNAPSPEEEESNEFFNELASQLDPFSYLLQPDAMATDDLIQSPSMHEWSQFTSLADSGIQPSQSKVEAMGFGGEFNFVTPMDLGLESTFVDPSALHFNTSIFTQPDPSIHAFNPTQTEFIPPSLTQLLSQNAPHPARRLSVTSSSSSSGTSLSPVLERQSPSEIATTIATNSHEELAQKVLQAIGATITVSPNASNLVAGTFIRSSRSCPVLTASSATGQFKLPEPRLNSQATDMPVTSKPSVVSQTTSESSPTSSSSLTTGPGRPKTGHTIIERRYRTNLNARITNLKQSVPALRVLEARLNGKDTGPNDTVDERGFVDGVKVGRKMSKANILGKATEYIRFVFAYLT